MRSVTLSMNLDRLEYPMTIYKQPGSPYYYYDFNGLCKIAPFVRLNLFEGRNGPRYGPNHPPTTQEYDTYGQHS
jgi:hypothetical protein